ncbi:heme-binding protein [Marinobacterium sp. D7]|uniref:GlcG/HbpS family heme-binding protein n=1 Tax=Marinobacterium ramblicola TaxID=2849041 RepID=UPI001C2D1467|nr:heme-binding protein [Marinobacterium ramblicola]MBV1788739.1 heme-binding protein [Marinobacterium ramblicola]
MIKTESLPSLTLEAAQLLADAALKRATELDVKMNIAIVDRAGNPLVVLRMPGAPLPAFDFAQKKAYTAANFKAPTLNWKEKLENRPVVMTGLAQHPRVALFGGGEPVIVDGQVVGGIGVAGGREDEDILCAQAALEALANA